MGYDFELAGTSHVVHPVHVPGRGRLSIEGRGFDAELFPGLVPGEHILEIAGRQERIFVAVRGDVHFIHYRGRVHRVEAVNALERARRAADPGGGAEELRAPMPGTVVEVIATEGAEVTAGELLMTIESMKLQTAITAPHDCRVAEIPVSMGATFDQGDVLVRLETPDETGDDSSEENAEKEKSK